MTDMRMDVSPATVDWVLGLGFRNKTGTQPYWFLVRNKRDYNPHVTLRQFVSHIPCEEPARNVFDVSSPRTVVR